MLSFAWKIRDSSTWHVVGLTLLLALLVGLFFVVFRVTYPVVQQADAVPQHLLVLDPADPGSLAIIHRAQDRSFGLVPAEPTDTTVMAQFPTFTPSYAGAELKLRPMVAVPETTRQPRLFSASTSVLPAVPPRASSLPEAIPDAVLKAVLPAELSRRAGNALEIKDVPVTDPENARFRIAVDASGHVTEVLPLFASTEPAITSKMLAAIHTLRFKADAKTPVQWATLAFEWQNASR
jgi:hypothetical protein